MLNFGKYMPNSGNWMCFLCRAWYHCQRYVSSLQTTVWFHSCRCFSEEGHGRQWPLCSHRELAPEWDGSWDLGSCTPHTDPAAGWLDGSGEECVCLLGNENRNPVRIEMCVQCLLSQQEQEDHLKPGDSVSKQTNKQWNSPLISNAGWDLNLVLHPCVCDGVRLCICTLPK
jgi:hypothetical protein